jgi:hypothetical protein
MCPYVQEPGKLAAGYEVVAVELYDKYADIFFPDLKCFIRG